MQYSTLYHPSININFKVINHHPYIYTDLKALNFLSLSTCTDVKAFYFLPSICMHIPQSTLYHVIYMLAWILKHSFFSFIYLYRFQNTPSSIIHLSAYISKHQILYQSFDLKMLYLLSFICLLRSYSILLCIIHLLVQFSKHIILYHLSFI